MLILVESNTALSSRFVCFLSPRTAYYNVEDVDDDDAVFTQKGTFCCFHKV